ncbi:site-specific recombinase [Chitinilyticum piscinae]|uniref:Site-specific recombinase n=1 Tax=Chitinilyticum piscinae TaxID=2866724 RepID=A0A8J7FKV1_9NEIS|nr:site-specific recombinase [Chitinilyticum piscinae]MBE9608011.1 site-specific recombinase [Chitinilyticum piscinae]
MEHCLQAMVDAPASTALENVRALIGAIRPKQASDSATAINNLRALSFLLEQHPAYREALRTQLDQLMGNTRQVQLYTDTGILSNEPLLAGLRRRIGERLLPIKPRPELLKDVFGLLFDRKDDYLWLTEIPYQVWADMCHSLMLDVEFRPDRYSQLQRLEAIQVLSCRIATIGLEPELVQNSPDMARFESPFVRQNVETQSFIENYRNALVAETELDDDQKQIMVLLDQCTEQIGRIRKHALRHGVSVSLTYHLLRLEQHIERMQTLLELVDPVPSPNWGPSLLRLFLQLVQAENRKHSLRDVLRENTELLALQVTEHASHTGEHYIAESRREWLGMFRAAAGAGIIVGFMALLKILIAKAHLPPLIEAIAFGLNYGIGFIIVHLLHCTIATKQPAMTAATIAATLPPPGSKSVEGYSALVELIVKVARTQFIAIMGNVLLAMPVALGLALLWSHYLGEPFINLDKAGVLLHDLRPLEGLGLPHAAIAGVWLFLAGLISGYYDNKALYHRLPERIAAHPLLNRLLGEHRSWKLGRYVEHNLGALAGNFYFGMMLGLTGFVGFLLGLPLDIRHITFSSANLAFVAAAVDFNLSWQIALLGLAGVAIIGATNLTVSFTLALWTAMRSRQRLLSELKPLLGMLLKHFMRRPQDFFIAPRQPKNSETTAGESA